MHGLIILAELFCLNFSFVLFIIFKTLIDSLINHKTGENLYHGLNQLRHFTVFFFSSIFCCALYIFRWNIYLITMHVFINIVSSYNWQIWTIIYFNGKINHFLLIDFDRLYCYDNYVCIYNYECKIKIPMEDLIKRKRT